MYTQCPECGVAFRVTAEVLKMAAGKVRCGGCGVAFNALEHLSESKPVVTAPPEDLDDSSAPELPGDETPELEADTPPESISAEQSAALLKTLDELAGEDIRIEDTGVEWRVIDDEPEAAEEAPAEPADEPSQVIDEMLFDDNTVLPDDFDAVVDAPSQTKPVEAPERAEPAAPEPPQFDLDLSEPEEWDDLLGDIEEPGQEEDVAEAAEADIEEIEKIDEPAAEFDDDDTEPPDMDTQFAIQAEAMGIDTTGVHESLEVDESEGGEAVEEDFVAAEADDVVEDKSDTSIEEDLIAAAFETEATAKTIAEELPDEDGVEDEPEEADEDVEIDLQLQEEVDTEDDVDDIALRFDNKVEEDIATLSMSLDDEPEEEPEEQQEDEPVAEDPEHVIPEMSEEEKTINMMIDEELLSIAVEDEDGFASTIVQIQPDDKIDKEIAEKETKKKDKKDKKGKKKDKSEKKKAEKERAPEDKPETGEDGGAVETIIMEGEFVRADLDAKRLAAENAADSGGNGFSIPLNREKDDYERRREMTWSRSGPGMYLGAILLALLLVVQFLHQSRDALATVPAFNSAVGPLYRALGQPLTPAWNISGWRFEATRGDTDEIGEVLTIYSRVGNNSDEGLPYPLVHVSLTDRFEDIIGSAILEPTDYLPENADPRQLVPPGSTFNAVISIESPSAEATGFKLNVCYRLATGQLRCADHDFK